MKLLEDLPTHYLLDDGQRPFRVPKAGLSEAMHARIRAMAAREDDQSPRMAKGGKVSGKVKSGEDWEEREKIKKVIEKTPKSLQRETLESKENARAAEHLSHPEMIDELAIEMAEGGGVPGGMRPAFFQPAMPGVQLSDVSLAPLEPPAPTISGVPVIKPAAQPETTLVQTGATPEGTPIVERKTGFVQGPPIQGLRPKEAPAAPSAPRPKGGGMAVPPAVSPEMEAAQREAMGAAETQYAAEREKAKATAEGIAEMGRVLERTQAERKHATATAKKQTDEAMTRVRAAQDELNRVDTNVDPGRFWASRTTGDKVLGVLGLVLGAIGAGNDGVNRAAGILSQAIDRDLEAQRASHEMRLRKGAAGVEAAQSFYAMARNAAQDDLAATDLARSMALESAANRAAQLEATTAEPMAKARLSALRAQLMGQAAENKAKAQQTLFDNKLKIWHESIEAQKAGAKGGASPVEAKDLRAAVAAHRTLVRTVDELKGLVSSTGPVTEKFGERAGQMQTLAGSLLLQVKTAEGLGALDKGSIQVAEQIIGDPSETFTFDSTKIAKLSALVEQSKRKVENMAGVVQ